MREAIYPPDHPYRHPIGTAAELDAATLDDADVSVADVQRVAKLYAAPGAMRIVVLGDAARVRSQLAALSLGAIKVRSGGNGPRRADPVSTGP